MKSVRYWVLVLAAVLAGGVAARAELPRPPEASESVAATPAPSAAGRGAVAYRSLFEKNDVGAEWSKQTVTKCPSGKHTFLGPFAYESTMLTLDNLPEHERVRISFDVMIMLTWDGDANLDNPTPTAPDLFDVTVDRGPRLVHASFTARPSSSSNTTQSFPGRFPYEHLPPGTGAVESRTLGYVWNGGIGDGPDDYVYHAERTFAHRGKSLKVAFSGINLEEVANESWGLENVRVEVLPAEPAGKFAKGAFERLWTDLGSDDPKAFVPAIDGLIDLGDPAVAALRKRLEPPARLPDQDREIGILIAQLDNDAYAVRENAWTALRNWGAAAAPALRTARATATSPEVCTRLDALLERLRGGQVESAAERRWRRLVEVWELIGTDEARAGLADIGKQAGTLAAWEANAALQRLEGKAEIPTKLDLPPGLPKNGSSPQVPPPTVPFGPGAPMEGLIGERN